MGLLILLQVVFDLAFIATATLLLIERSKLRTQEDPRMSRGLQLLSNKIAILQDLMDRSESTGRSLSQLIDGKQQSIQERLEEVEVHLSKVQVATEKSKEVAQIFQDKIPHREFIERQNTIKYSQAAKLANQGFSAEDIARQVDIPRGELDLIAKVNRHRIITKEPVWLAEPEKEQVAAVAQVVAPAPAPAAVVAAVAAPTPAPAAVEEMVSFSAPLSKSDKVIKPVLFKKISMPVVDEIELK